MATSPINYRLAGVSQGGNAGSYFKPRIREALDAFPVRLVRIEMVPASPLYHLYDAATGTFDWTKLDAEIEAVQAQGAEILINLFGTPPHLVSDDSAKVPAFTPPTDFQAYADFCAKIVHHVNVEKQYGVRLWEIWNEPSGGWFWSAWRTDGGETFFRLYGLVARAVKAADSQALVGGFGDNMQYPEHYRALFRHLKQDAAPVDFLTVHYYGAWAATGANSNSVCMAAKCGGFPGIFQSRTAVAAENQGARRTRTPNAFKRVGWLFVNAMVPATPGRST